MLSPCPLARRHEMRLRMLMSQGCFWIGKAMRAQVKAGRAASTMMYGRISLDLPCSSALPNTSTLWCILHLFHTHRILLDPCYSGSLGFARLISAAESQVSILASCALLWAEAVPAAAGTRSAVSAAEMPARRSSVRMRARVSIAPGIGSRGRPLEWGVDLSRR